MTMEHVVETAPVSPTRKTKKPPTSVLEREAFALKRRLLLEALVAADWSVTKAQEPLQMSKANILRAIEQFGLQDVYDQHRPKRGPRPKT
jgi:transcriptional regulator with GAF, ATPase, and Fis domain